MTDETPLNPVDIEKAIRECSDRIHRGVKVVTEAERAARKAARTYGTSYAMAYVGLGEYPAHERKYRAVLATQTELEAQDDAEIAYKYAERTAKAVVEELRAWQSVGASVRTMYGAS